MTHPPLSHERRPGKRQLGLGALELLLERLRVVRTRALVHALRRVVLPHHVGVELRVVKAVAVLVARDIAVARAEERDRLGGKEREIAGELAGDCGRARGREGREGELAGEQEGDSGRASGRLREIASAGDSCRNENESSAAPSGATALRAACCSCARAISSMALSCSVHPAPPESSCIATAPSRSKRSPDTSSRPRALCWPRLRAPCCGSPSGSWSASAPVRRISAAMSCSSRAYLFAAGGVKSRRSQQEARGAASGRGGAHDASSEPSSLIGSRRSVRGGSERMGTPSRVVWLFERRSISARSSTCSASSAASSRRSHGPAITWCQKPSSCPAPKGETRRKLSSPAREIAKVSRE